LANIFHDPCFTLVRNQSGILNTDLGFTQLLEDESLTVIIEHIVIALDSRDPPETVYIANSNGWRFRQLARRQGGKVDLDATVVKGALCEGVDIGRLVKCAAHRRAQHLIVTTFLHAVQPSSAFSIGLACDYIVQAI